MYIYYASLCIPITLVLHVPTVVLHLIYLIINYYVNSIIECINDHYDVYHIVTYYS